MNESQQSAPGIIKWNICLTIDFQCQRCDTQSTPVHLASACTTFLL
jgi:hypothetical protein